MKKYPSISKISRKVDVFMFDKLDGSNIRAEWTRKKGFVKYGRRNGLLDDSNPHLLNAPPLIEEHWVEDLSRIFRDKRLTKATAYFELHGPGSFSGNHVEGDDFKCTLIDVAVDKKGILSPDQFTGWFKGLEHAELLHRGRVTPELVEQIKSGTLPGMTFEGVVCKVGGKPDRPGRPYMWKIKNQAWIDRLRVLCGDNDQLFERLL